MVIIGLHNRLEIWSDKLWNIYREKAENNIEDFASKLSNLGI